MNLTPGEIVYCRFTRESFIVISYAGGCAVLRDESGDITHRIRGDIRR